MENNSEPQSIDYSKALKIPLKRGRKTEQNGQKFYTLPPVKETLPLVQDPLPLEKDPSPPMFLPHSPTYEKVELPKQESPPYAEEQEQEQGSKEKQSSLDKKESPLNKKQKSSSEESQDLKLEDFVDHYFNEKDIDRNKNHEIEVRFGTKRNVKPLSKNDYFNVIKKLKSLGFTCSNESGLNSLKIASYHLGNKSAVRVQIDSLEAIQKYCKTNSIQKLMEDSATMRSVTFVMKKNIVIDTTMFYPIDYDDFNFRVSYQTEENISKNLKDSVIKEWNNNEKSFRYMNRVTFTHKDYPVNVDISIVKSSAHNKPTYTIQDSNVFNNPEKIEMEIELQNYKIGENKSFDSPDDVSIALKKVIKYVLSGLQGTNYPISYPEQMNVMKEYMVMLHNKDYEPKYHSYPQSKQFIGPSSLPIQLENICEIANGNVPNIRKDYVVTEKADGERHLLFVNEKGRIYLINNTMNIIFTGALTLVKERFNTLVDGELILTNKTGKSIHLFAIFDIYYENGKDVRGLSFMPKSKPEDKLKETNDSRYAKMKHFVNELKPYSILDDNKGKRSERSDKTNICPIQIVAKQFEPDMSLVNANIFQACNNILSKIHDGRFEYLTDGLIFTPAYLAVGATNENENKAGPLHKITWSYSLKWKPLNETTIDFFVSTVKNTNNEDIVKSIFEDGTKADAVNQVAQYKSIELCCTYSEKSFGFVNPCQKILDGEIPSSYDKSNNEGGSDDRKPMRFYPTEPYDPDAGMTNIMLKADDNNVMQMFTEENEIFGDKMIVEFSYEIDREKEWRWIPKRVRYDKTSEYLQGIKNFGNAYPVANSNWKLINNPITEEMIRTGNDIPSQTVAADVYYNKQSGSFETEAMKNFHNLYVKKKLITSVSRENDILIDYACGKGGDLAKWTAAKLSFVFGIDKSLDNIENRLDGACVRYLNTAKNIKNIPKVLFINGNSTLNIKNGDAIINNNKSVEIIKAIFGNISKEKADKLGNGVAKQYKVAESGFQISSCQFATHYFFESLETLRGFLTNVAECTALNGYFIGTCYDGEKIFKMLKKKRLGESVEMFSTNNASINPKKICEIVKGYDADTFEDDESSVGLRIDVYQESINQFIPEYLVNFKYLNRLLEDYGFVPIGKEEANRLGLPMGIGSFRSLFTKMMEEINRNPNKSKDYGNAMNMSNAEKDISYLNNYFVYKKIRNINANDVVLSSNSHLAKSDNLAKSDDLEKEDKDELVEGEKPFAIRDLNNQIELVPATEALEESKSDKKKKKNKTKKQQPKLLIIEEDDDDEEEIQIVPKTRIISKSGVNQNKTKKHLPITPPLPNTPPLPEYTKQTMLDNGAIRVEPKYKFPGDLNYYYMNLPNEKKIELENKTYDEKVAYLTNIAKKM